MDEPSCLGSVVWRKARGGRYWKGCAEPCDTCSARLPVSRSIHMQNGLCPCAAGPSLAAERPRSLSLKKIYRSLSSHKTSILQPRPLMTTQEEFRFMEQALELARKGIGLTSPNPSVGALIVNREGKIVGRGTYTYDSLKHAEILALEQAGASARGATLYINLEPCCHHGRTGPCVEALISSGVGRVVAAIADPNPLVSGRGFEQLRSAGIAVEVGPGAEEAQKLNEAFAKYIRHKTPLLTLKAAMTLDGKIAPPPGESANPTALGVAGVSGGW